MHTHVHTHTQRERDRQRDRQTDRQRRDERELHFSCACQGRSQLEAEEAVASSDLALQKHARRFSPMLAGYIQLALRTPTVTLL